MSSHRMTKDYDNDLNKMIFISLLLHTFVLAIIFFLPSLPSPRLTFGPIYSVDLVSFSQEFQSRKSLSSIPQAFKETIPNAQILKKQLDASSVPIKRMDVQKKQVSSVEKAIEDIKRKVTSATDKTSPSTPEGESGSKANAYYALIWSRIKGQWALPQGILPRDNIEAIIHARILKNGTVVDLGFERHSGNRYFDESAMKAIKKASPFPPLPGWLKDNSIEVGIRFHSSEFR